MDGYGCACSAIPTCASTVASGPSRPVAPDGCSPRCSSPAVGSSPTTGWSTRCGARTSRRRAGGPAHDRRPGPSRARPRGPRSSALRSGYRLRPDRRRRRRRRVPTALARARARPSDTGRALAAYDEALALWRGPAWAGLADDIAQSEALRLEEAHVATREERAAALLALGRAPGGGRRAAPLVAEQPLRDRPALLLMRALHRLGASPMPWRSTPPTARRSPTSSGWTRRPSWCRPSATCSSEPRPRPRRRGAPPPRLVGRDSDLAQVRRLLTLHRCVTVVGPGGVGKTSLAREVLADPPSKLAWWVDLTSVTTDAGVRAVVASALGVEVFPGGSVEAALHRPAGDREGLLVLDNCEHVLGAAADLSTGHRCGWARASASWRPAASGSGLPVEQVFPLPPLRLPGRRQRATPDVPSVALFLERARSAAPELEVTPDDAGRGRPSSSAGSTGSPSPSSSPPAASGWSPWHAARPARRPARPAPLPPPAADPPGTRRWRTPSTGPTTCSTRTSDGPAMALGLRRPVRPGRRRGGARAGLGRAGARSCRALAARTPGGGRRQTTACSRPSVPSRGALLDDGERHEAGHAHATWAADVAAAARAGMAGPDAGWWTGRVDALLPEFGRAVFWGLETGRVEEATRIVA